MSKARRDLRSGQAEQSNNTKETFNNRRGHNAVAVPFSGGALHCRYATPSHPHALRNRKPKACSTIESLQASRCLLQLRVASRLSHVASGNHKNTHNTHTHPRRIARQHAEAGRRSTRGSMRLEVKARSKGVRGRRIMPKKSTPARRTEQENNTCITKKREIIFWSF